METQTALNVGYIYLSQEIDCVDVNESIFKVGKNIQKNHAGLKQQHEQSRLLFQIVCSDCDNCEREIKVLFGNKYKHCDDIGIEYFKGSYKEMINDIFNVVMSNDKSIDNIDIGRKITIDQEQCLVKERECRICHVSHADAHVCSNGHILCNGCFSKKGECEFCVVIPIILSCCPHNNTHNNEITYSNDGIGTDDIAKIQHYSFTTYFVGNNVSSKIGLSSEYSEALKSSFFEYYNHLDGIFHHLPHLRYFSF